MAEPTKTTPDRPTPTSGVPGTKEKPKDETISDPVVPPPPPPEVPEDDEHERVTSGRYRLDKTHVWPGDVLLQAGTIVGDDTDYPFPEEGWPKSDACTEVDDKGNPVNAPKTKPPKGLPGQGARTR